MATENKSEVTTTGDLIPPAGIVLAALWIVLPAFQYVGTYQRTAATVSREIPRGGLERMDLTPWYVLLVGLTLVYIALTTMTRYASIRDAESTE